MDGWLRQGRKYNFAIHFIDYDSVFMVLRRGVGFAAAPVVLPASCQVGTQLIDLLQW